MKISEQELSWLKQLDAQESLAIVGYFPSCKVQSRIYPEGEIHLQKGFQNPKNIHNGFGLMHLIYGSHTQENLYQNVSCVDDIIHVLKSALKKHSKIYMERADNFIVISNAHAKVVLEFLEQERIYSVVTCHAIAHYYRAEKHGNVVAKIKKDLYTTLQNKGKAPII